MEIVVDVPLVDTDICVEVGLVVMDIVVDVPLVDVTDVV
jgi:hypothetical protein